MHNPSVGRMMYAAEQFGAERFFVKSDGVITSADHEVRGNRVCSFRNCFDLSCHQLISLSPLDLRVSTRKSPPVRLALVRYPRDRYRIEAWSIT